MGIATRLPGESAQTWLDRADRAMYAAKSRGLGIAEAPEPGRRPSWLLAVDAADDDDTEETSEHSRERARADLAAKLASQRRGRQREE